MSFYKDPQSSAVDVNENDIKERFFYELKNNYNEKTKERVYQKTLEKLVEAEWYSHEEESPIVEPDVNGTVSRIDRKLEDEEETLTLKEYVARNRSSLDPDAEKINHFLRSLQG